MADEADATAQLLRERVGRSVAVFKVGFGSAARLTVCKDPAIALAHSDAD